MCVNVFSQTEYSVTLQTPYDVFGGTFNCPDDVYILNQADEEGFDLPYSCRSGAYSSCAAIVLSGLVNNSDQTFLDDCQLDAGFTLLCVAYPMSDVTILTHQEEELTDFGCGSGNINNSSIWNGTLNTSYSGGYIQAAFHGYRKLRFNLKNTGATFAPYSIECTFPSVVQNNIQGGALLSLREVNKYFQWGLYTDDYTSWAFTLASPGNVVINAAVFENRTN